MRTPWWRTYSSSHLLLDDGGPTLCGAEPQHCGEHALNVVGVMTHRRCARWTGAEPNYCWSTATAMR
jgi:hypothetical protein